VGDKRRLNEEESAALLALWPAYADFSEEEQNAILADIRRINGLAAQYTYVALRNNYDALLLYDTLDIDPRSDDATTLSNISAAGFDNVFEGIETLQSVDALGIEDAEGLARQLGLIETLFDLGYLQSETVNEALDTELDSVLHEHLVIRRPGVGTRNLLIGDDLGGDLAGIIRDESAAAEAGTSARRPPVVFVQVFGRAILFFPQQLERTLVRSVIYIVAGLAVALACKLHTFEARKLYSSAGV